MIQVLPRNLITENLPLFYLGYAIKLIVIYFCNFNECHVLLYPIGFDSNR